MNRAAMPTKTLSLWIGIILFALLQGCGGGGTRGRASGDIPAPDGAPAAESIQLLVESPTVDSSGLFTVDLTAVVLDEARRAVPDKIITLKVTDPNNTAFLNGFSEATGRTNEEGLLTARLNVGTNRANRELTVAAEADGQSDTGAVSVIGTKVELTGANSLVSNATTPLTISVKDSAGNPVIGAAVTVSSQRSNTLSPTTGITNQNGQLVVTVTGTNPGLDTITASSLGASSTATIDVSGSDFSFVSPASNEDIEVNIAQTLRVRWFDNGAAQVGRTLSFNATRGAVTPSTVVVGADGTASVSITASSAGPTTVTASEPDGSPATALNFIFVTKRADSLNLQADRSTVTVNPLGSDTNRTTIRAVVRDSANNLVKNARVEFQLAQDPTAGRLATSSDISDVSGIATTDYIAGSISSNQNGVVVTARVTDVGGVPVPSPAPSALTTSVSITVAGQSLFIRLGSDNKVTSAPPVYIKRFAALVTDAAGNPQPNLRVQFEVNPAQPPLRAYAKGYYVEDRTAGNLGTAGVWRPVRLAECFNEDLNLNGILEPFVSEDTNYSGFLDAGEDSNGNGILDFKSPAIPAVDIGFIGGANGLLDPGEDANSNGTLDAGEDTNAINEDKNFNTILDPNEDLDRDGLLDPGEDFNGNGLLDFGEDLNGNGFLERAERLHQNGLPDLSEDFNLDGSLTPGNISSATTNILTDNSGIAYTDITYAQNFANWATVTLQAKVIVAGTESVSRVSFVLSAAAADLANLDISPPGDPSPFGLRRNCSDRR
jgi:hypothetical protein